LKRRWRAWSPSGIFRVSGSINSMTLHRTDVYMSEFSGE
jgi:hypothetical protein